MKTYNNEKEQDVKVVALGGLGEVGKNMYVIMHNSEIIMMESNCT